MIDGVNLARLNLGVALRGNLNALWVDVVITRRTGIANQAFPSQRRETLSLRRRESQYFFLKINDGVHRIKYSA